MVWLVTNYAYQTKTISKSKEIVSPEKMMTTFEIFSSQIYSIMFKVPFYLIQTFGLWTSVKIKQKKNTAKRFLWPQQPIGGRQTAGS